MRTQNGSITKQSGSWLGHYSKWITDSTTGEKTRQQRAFKIGEVESMTKAEARRHLRKRIEEELGLRSDSRVNLKWFIEQRWVPLRESTWRKSTKEVNTWMLGCITERFGTVPLEDTDGVALQLWINQLAKQRSASFVRHIRIFLKSIFAEAVEQDYLRKSPARLLRIPELKKVKRPYLSIDEVKALLSKAEKQDKVLLRLLLVTGLRPSELFALQWKAFDAGKKLLHITQSLYRGDLRNFTKTTDENSRPELQVVFLPDFIVSDLQEWRAAQPVRKVDELTPVKYRTDAENFIFTSSEEVNSEWWKENYVHRRLNPLVCRTFHDGTCAKNRTNTKCKGENVPLVNFQVLRRTVATHADSLGSPKTLAAILRHTNPSTAALNYVQQQSEAVRATAEKLASTFLQ